VEIIPPNLLKLSMCAFSILMKFNNKKWLSDAYSSRSIFPRIYNVYYSDRGCHTKLHGGGALLDVSDADFGIKRRSDLDYFQECVWVEITVTGGLTCLLAFIIWLLTLWLILSRTA
jgi:hypothetical protein